MPLRPSLAAAVLLTSGLLVAGKAKDDPETAKRRAAFANGDIPAVAKWPTLTAPAGWTCAYHATTHDLVFPGQDDATYHTTFALRGAVLDETSATFTGSYHWSQAGLRTESADGAESRLIRLLDNGRFAVEWLYEAAPGDERGDPGIGDPHRRSVGFATCTPAAAL